MNILAIDAATTTGWAALTEAGAESGTRHFPLRRGSSPGMRFVEFEAWLAEMIALQQPAVVVYEMSHFQGGAATELCVGFTTRIMSAAARAGIEYRGVHTGALKLWATGSGNAGKDAMQRAAGERFPFYDASGDPGADEADALLLLSYALSGFPVAVPKNRKTRKTTA